jgi:hypothetical protein
LLFLKKLQVRVPLPLAPADGASESWISEVLDHVLHVAGIKKAGFPCGNPAE